MLKILLIEDERINRLTLEKMLLHAGYEVTTAEDGTQGMEAIRSQKWDVILSDYRLPGHDGLQILEESKKLSPETHVLIMTAFATVDNALDALKKGAFDYLTKPFDPAEMFHHLDRIKELNSLSAENKALKSSLAELKVAPDLIGQSPKMLELFDKIKVVAESEHTVLIEGASGTGKERIANAVQKFSLRKDMPFVRINCSALTETLFETEMFGHEKGAFTGAVKRSLGRFERAKGGTIFLDDIDDLSLRLQTKLLRVIQEGEIERVGGSEVISVDVRLIAATKIDLRNLVNSKEFREDLFYRLNVIKLKIPTLNNRVEDIPLLAHHFLGKTSPKKSLSPLLVDYLSTLAWPGNVRELEHLITQMSVFSTKEVIDLSDLPESYRHEDNKSTRHLDERRTLPERILSFEIQIIQDSMDFHNGHQQKVADALGIPRTTLRSKLIKYGLLDLEQD